MYDETFEPEKTYDAYDAVIARFPAKAAMFHFLKAEEYAGQSRLREAYDEYDRALTMGYSPAEVRYAMARCKERTGDEAGAGVLYGQIADAADADAVMRSKAALQRAEIAADVGDMTTAKIYWTKTISFGLKEAPIAKKRLSELL
jgi:tetratricopeptide (TPR) repeat protein